MIEEGTIKSIVDKIYSLEQVAEAHFRVETEQRLGTVVISKEEMVGWMTPFVTLKRALG